MAIPIKNSAEISAMRKSGRILAEVLEKTSQIAKEGVSTYELDQFAEELIRQKGGIPAFKGYNGFPGTLCTGVNEVVVHGIPRKDEILKEGDLLTIDCGVIYDGMYSDAARSIGIGKISSQKQKMIDIAYLALSEAIDLANPGTPLNMIGKKIQEIVEKSGFHIIYDLTGHGIGKELHEDPIVLNYWDGKPGPILEVGMTLAIEPIFSIGSNEIETLPDHWTLVTTDRSVAVQVENTILISQNGAEILTAL